MDARAGVGMDQGEVDMRFPQCASMNRIFMASLVASMGMATGALGATLTVTPASVLNSYSGAVSLRAAALPSNSDTVVFDEFLDLNANNLIDADEPLVQSCRVTDNQIAMIGGVTNSSVLSDTNSLVKTIGTSFAFPAAGYGQTFVGKYRYRLSSVTNGFPPVTAAFTVTANTSLGQSIGGRVLCGGTNVPYALVLLYAGQALNGYPVAGTVADGTGAYTLRAAPGTYGLVAARKGYVADSARAPVLALAPGATVVTNLNLLQATRTISGQFYRAGGDGIRLPAVAVGALSSDGLVSFGFARTNGTFDLPALPSQWGQWSLFVDDSIAQGHARPQTLPTADVTDGDVSGLDLTLTPGTAMVYGAARDLLNRPVSVNISAFDADGLFTAGSATDTNGNYAIAVPPSTNWSARVVAIRGTNVNYVFTQGTNLALNIHQAVRQNIAALAATNRITGTVKDSHGNPVVGLSVAVDGTVGSTNCVAMDGRTDTNGFYSIRVAAGSWRVRLPNAGPSGLAALGYLPVADQTVVVTGAPGAASFIVQSKPVTIAVVAQPEDGGSILGGGVYERRQWTNLTAAASNGFRFVRWQDGVTNATRAVQALRDATYTAFFGQAVTLGTSVTPAGGGQATGGGVFGVGAVATLVATPADGYRFVQWQDGDTNAVRQVVVLPGLTFTARFVALGTVVGVAQPPEAGAVTGGGAYDAGQQVTLQAVASDSHFLFTGWADGGSSTSRTLTVVAGMNVRTAQFVSAVIVRAASSSTEAGRVTSSPAPTGGTLATGGQFVSNAMQNVTLTAAASNGWRFANWSDGAGNTTTRKIFLGADTNLTANFIRQVKLTVLPNSTHGGSVSGGGTFDAGASVEIRAVAKKGWRFKVWNDNNANAIRSVTLPDGDLTLTAQFVQQFTLKTSVSPAVAGSVSGGGVHDMLASVVISATPRTGYLFKQWQDKNQVASRRVTVTKDMSFTAYFTAAGTVVGLANPPEGGGVTGGGVYVVGAMAVLTAVSNEGFVFSRWSDNVTALTRTNKVTAGTTTFTAQFVPAVTVVAAASPPEAGQIRVSPLPPEGRSLAAGVQFPSNDTRTATLSASANVGWRFSGWSDGVTPAATRSIMLNASTNVTAIFERQYGEVVGLTSPPGAGTVDGGGVYGVGETAALHAHSTGADTVFSRWSDGATNAMRAVSVVSGTAVYTALFVPAVTVSAVASPTRAGSISISPLPPEGGSLATGVKYPSNALQSVTLTVKTNGHWRFVNWTDGVAGSQSRQIRLSTDTNLIANFQCLTTLNVRGYPDNTGTISGSGTYIVGASVNLRASPVAGWRFARWDDDPTNTSPVRVVTVSETDSGTKYYRGWFAQQIRVSTAAQPPTAGRVAGGGLYDAWTNATLEATVTDFNYRFARWSDGVTDPVRTVQVLTPTLYTAVFVPGGTVAGTIQPPEAGKMTGAGSYDPGTNVNLTATSTNAAFVFSHWDNDSTSTARTFTVARGLNNVTAYFATAVVLRASVVPAAAGVWTLSPPPTEGGNPAAGVRYATNSTVVLTLAPTNRWRLASWSDGAPAGNVRSVNLGSNQTLTAVLEPFARLTVLAAPPDQGLVTGGGDYTVGAHATLTAQAMPGCVFDRWSDGNGRTSRVVQATADIAYTAVFSRVCAVTVQASPAVAGVATGSGVYRTLSVIDLAAVCTNAAYRFDRWQDGNPSAMREVTVTGPTNYTALFIAVPLPLVKAAVAGMDLSVSGPARVAEPFETLTAVRADHLESGENVLPLTTEPPALILRVDVWGTLPTADREGVELLRVTMHLGRLEVHALDPGSSTGIVWRTTLETQGVDANANGLPDALESLLGVPVCEGMELLRVVLLGGNAVAETPHGTRWRIEKPAVSLGQPQASWRIVSVEQTKN